MGPGALCALLIGIHILKFGIMLHGLDLCGVVPGWVGKIELSGGEVGEDAE